MHRLRSLRRGRMLLAIVGMLVGAVLALGVVAVALWGPLARYVPTRWLASAGLLRVDAAEPHAAARAGAAGADAHDHDGDEHDAHGHDEHSDADPDDAGHAAAAEANEGAGHDAHAVNDAPHGEDGHPHDEESHADEAFSHGAETAATHAAHAHAAALDSLTLSAQGKKNIGLTLAPVALRDIERTISIPGLIVERPGRTTVKVSAPLTGTVIRIHAVPGEAIRPGAPLMDLRLTHEDLVQKQSEMLKALEELDVVKREVARLEEVTASGAVAGKTLLERRYEQQKLEAALRVAMQSLKLHGLSQAQVDHIAATREMLQELTIVAPSAAEHTAQPTHDDVLLVESLGIGLGEQVTAGTHLATLSDYCELFIEGRAFASDADALNRIAAEKRDVTALIEEGRPAKAEVAGLKLLYVKNEVEPASRALQFYVLLPNQIVRDESLPEGGRFIGWRYKPGQRVEVLLPVERWPQRIALPLEAVVQEGAESYVYRQQGEAFVRRPVHVEYRDQRLAAIESDGSIKPGDVVAAAGAYQIHLALKNKSGGGPDPHAGHNH